MPGLENLLTRVVTKSGSSTPIEKAVVAFDHEYGKLIEFFIVWFELGFDDAYRHFKNESPECQALQDFERNIRNFNDAPETGSRVIYFSFEGAVYQLYCGTKNNESGIYLKKDDDNASPICFFKGKSLSDLKSIHFKDMPEGDLNSIPPATGPIYRGW